MSDETKMTEDKVRKEHVTSIDTMAHWGYLAGVLGGGFVVMVIVMAALGGGS